MKFFNKITFFIIISLYSIGVVAKTTTNNAEHANNILIVATIKPLYNLVAALTRETSVAKPVLLLRGNASPHDYNLRFSDVKLISQANLIVWGGDQLEFFLKKLLNQDKFTDKLLTVQDLPSLNKLTFRNSQYLDEHLWLSPDNAKIIIKAIEKQLSLLDPNNSTKYAANRRSFLTKLDTLDADIRAKLKILRHKKYLVFHDAYQYFEKFYGLHSPIAITDNPSIPLSIQRMLVIHDLIINQNVHCLFKEPQFSSKVLDSLLKSKDLNGRLKVGILDPLGSDEDLGGDGYFKLINNLATEFYNCFKE